MVNTAVVSIAMLNDQRVSYDYSIIIPLMQSYPYYYLYKSHYNPYYILLHIYILFILISYYIVLYSILIILMISIHIPLPSGIKLLNMAIEIGDLPIKMVIFHSFLCVYQRVYPLTSLLFVD